MSQPDAAQPMDASIGTNPPIAGAPKTGKGGKQPALGGPRRVRLVINRVDPWSVLKVSLLLNVAIGIMMVVGAAIVWFMLDSLHVFSQIQDLVGSVVETNSNAFTGVVEYMKFSRAISMSTIIAVVNLILSTALCTLAALIYNVIASLVGGIHLILADD